MQNETINKPKKLFVISGSSGVGKGTVIGGFLKKNPKFKLSISYTTRKKREGEVEGVNYFYISREEFLKGVENDEFLEWAEFSGNLYGTKKEYIKKCLDNRADIILEIDTQGALQVKEKLPNSVLIFIAPPSFEELESRLRGRNTESEEAILKRLESVKAELENSNKFDYVIVNDELENVIVEIEKLINNERAN
jgi:guanylate kinase